MIRFLNQRRITFGLLLWFLFVFLIAYFSWGDTAAEKPDQGEVMSVGKGKTNDEGTLMPLDVKVGDRVLFGKYSGQTVRVKGDELLVMREEDIMGVIEGA